MQLVVVCREATMKRCTYLLFALMLAACGGELDVVEPELEEAILTLPGDTPQDPPSASAPILVQSIDGHAVVEGDIVVPWEWLSADEDGTRRQALADLNNPSMTWPNGIVPYVFDRNLPKQTRDHIKAAIAHYHKHTNLRLVPRTTQVGYLKFTPSDGCRSWIGRLGRAQEVWLAPNCGTAAAIHEIGHAIGLWHEHTRQDRDNHVTIKWKNIAAGHEGNFQKYSSGRDLGRYDYKSIMHYYSGAFAKSDGLRTIIRKDGKSIGYNTVLSTRDIAGLARIYPPTPTNLAPQGRLCLDFADGSGSRVAEMGRVRLQQPDASTTHVVPFKAAFPETPIVFAETLSRRGGDPSIVQIVAVTPEHVELRVAEWEYLDGGHTAEDVTYYAVLPGSHPMHLPDGRRVFIANAETADLGSSFATIAEPAGSKRVVFAQPQTLADGIRKVARIHNVTNDGFDLRLQAQEKFKARALAPEPVGWLSITSPAAPLGHNRTKRSVGTGWFVVDFEPAGWDRTEDAVALLQLQSQYGSDPAHLRYRRLDGPRIDVFVEEEGSFDAETAHTTEKVGAVALPASLFEGSCPAVQ